MVEPEAVAQRAINGVAQLPLTQCIPALARRADAGEADATRSVAPGGEPLVAVFMCKTAEIRPAAMLQEQ